MPKPQEYERISTECSICRKCGHAATFHSVKHLSPEEHLLLCPPSSADSVESFIKTGEAPRDPEVLAMEAEITEELTAMPALYAFVEQIRSIIKSMDDEIRIPHPSLRGTNLKMSSIIDRCFHRGEMAKAKMISTRLRDRLETLENSLKALERRNNAQK